MPNSSFFSYFSFFGGFGLKKRASNPFRFKLAQKAPKIENFKRKMFYYIYFLQHHASFDFHLLIGQEI